MNIGNPRYTVTGMFGCDNKQFNLPSKWSMFGYITSEGARYIINYDKDSSIVDEQYSEYKNIFCGSGFLTEGEVKQKVKIYERRIKLKRIHNEKR